MHCLLFYDLNLIELDSLKSHYSVVEKFNKNQNGVKQAKIFNFGNHFLGGSKNHI